MARTRKQFVCRTCGAVQPRWMGKCPDCGAWDALEEFLDVGESAGSGVSRAVVGEAPRARPLSEITDEPAAGPRMRSGIGELDRVLGGGVVAGSVVLIGGDPGVGKSTLMLDAAGALADRGRRTLYVTSEESAFQLKLRAERLGLRSPDPSHGHDAAIPISTPSSSSNPDQDASPDPDGEAAASMRERANPAGARASESGADADSASHLFILADTNLARILEQARKLSPELIVVDSIQMLSHSDLSAAPGSVTQLRSCAQDLVTLAKTTGCAVLLVGHVTKQGQLAGPRLLEHMVDTVLYFEGDRYHNHRVVRAIKNRFGTTLEVGLFEMTDRGLREVVDGAGVLAAEYEARSGSVVCPVVHGSRCLLVEIQALTATGFLGGAKRKTSGLDPNRLAMLIAVLEKRGGLRLADQDVFASSVGGMKIVEPAVDLAVALAIAGAHHDRALPTGACAIGEIGLGGELRHVQQMPTRLTEAARLGFTHIIGPRSSVKPPEGCTLHPVKTLADAIEWLT